MNIIELQQELTNRNIKISGRRISQIWGMNEESYSRKKRAGSEIKYEDLKKLEQELNISLTGEERQNEIIRNLIMNGDRIEINYWSDLPEELKNPKIASVWFDREVIENAWGMKAEDLCIIPMVGDAMTNYWYPIRNGDILIINTQIEDIRGNGVYFGTSQNNTRFWIHEMQILMDMSIEFKSFSPSGNVNKTYSAKQLEEVNFRLIGKVIKNVSFRL